jgi:hypothetical protein
MQQLAGQTHAAYFTPIFTPAAGLAVRKREIERSGIIRLTNHIALAMIKLSIVFSLARVKQIQIKASFFELPSLPHRGQIQFSLPVIVLILW